MVFVEIVFEAGEEGDEVDEFSERFVVLGGIFCAELDLLGFVVDGCKDVVVVLGNESSSLGEDGFVCFEELCVELIDEFFM